MSPKEIQFSAIPDPSLYEKIGSVSFTTPQAIAELVANSVDAAVDGQRLEVDIEVSPEKITITDNGFGMGIEILAEAVRLGVSMDDVTGFEGKRKGMFGLGMKTACASLGRQWQVYTRPIGGGKEFRTKWDLKTWTAKSGEKGAEAFDFTIEERDKTGGPLGNQDNGTTIIITELRDKMPMGGAVLDHIGRTYAPHIGQGDIFRVNGEEADIPQYDLIEDRKWDVDVRIEADSIYYGNVTGWVGVAKKTRNDGSYGLNLYREKQLMAPWDKNFFRAHLMTSRVRGELNLDFVPPNFHKKGFETQSPEWKLTKSIMGEFLKSTVVKASTTVSKNKKDNTRTSRMIVDMDKALGDVGAVAGDVLETEEKSEESEEQSREPERMIEANQISIGKKVINLQHDVRALQGEKLLPWTYTYENREEVVHLTVLVNSNALIFEKTTAKTLPFLCHLALGDCVTEYMMKEHRMDIDSAKQYRNEWLHKAVEKM